MDRWERERKLTRLTLTLDLFIDRVNRTVVVSCCGADDEAVLLM